MQRPLVILATATTTTREDEDMGPLVQALNDVGIEARVQAWDDPHADFTRAAAVVIRSTWNYVHHYERFVAWCDRVARLAPLWNPPTLIRWNSHKGYLLELAQRGVPIVPTRFVPRAAKADLKLLMGDWPVAVVKPAISAGSFATVKVPQADLAQGQAHLDRFSVDRDMLVQRYQPGVEGYGERALIWMGGRFTHAVRKGARFLGDPENITAAAIADDERELAERIMTLVPRPVLFARVDLVRDENECPMLMELELIEPALFFSRAPGSVSWMASAIRDVL